MPERGIDGGTDEEMLSRERRALLSLAVHASRDPDDRAERLRERDVEVLSVDDAIHELAELSVADQRAVPRVVVLDLLVKLASRKGHDFGEVDREALVRLVEDMAGERPGIADRPDDDVTSTVVTALRSTTGTISPAGAWQSFVANGGAQALSLHPVEVAKPACDDRGHMTVRGHDACVVETTYYSSQGVAELKPWVDPRNWPTCSPFFRGMEQVDPKGGPPTPAQAPILGWDATFVETVHLLEEMNTPLRFRYREAPDGSWARCEYREVGKTQHLDVDQGFLWVGTDPAAPAGTPTLIKAVKIVGFTDPAVHDWPELACDTFWTAMVIGMATGCGSLVKGTTTGGVMTGSATGASSSSSTGASTSASAMPAGEDCAAVVKQATAVADAWYELWKKWVAVAADVAAGKGVPDVQACTDETLKMSTAAMQEATKAWQLWAGYAQKVVPTASPPSDA